MARSGRGESPLLRAHTTDPYAAASVPHTMAALSLTPHPFSDPVCLPLQCPGPGRTLHSVSAMARDGRRSPGTVPAATRHTPRQRTRCLDGGKEGQHP